VCGNTAILKGAEAVKTIMVFLLLAGFTQAGSAAPLWCTGTLINTMMVVDGTVMIYPSWLNNWTAICSTEGTFGAVPTEVCLTWYATAIKAQTTPLSVTIYYADASTYTCSTLPTYTSAIVPNQFILQ
jgi:hypothetical protein